MMPNIALMRPLRRISGGDRRNGNAAATIRPGLPRT